MNVLNLQYFNKRILLTTQDLGGRCFESRTMLDSSFDCCFSCYPLICSMSDLLL